MMCDESQKREREDAGRQEEQTETGVSLRSLIAPAFAGLHRTILEQDGEYVLKAGGMVRCYTPEGGDTP